MVKIQIVPNTSADYFGMVDLIVSKNGKAITILCNTVKDAFKALERDSKAIEFLLD